MTHYINYHDCSELGMIDSGGRRISVSRNTTRYREHAIAIYLFSTHALCKFNREIRINIDYIPHPRTQTGVIQIINSSPRIPRILESSSHLVIPELYQ